MTLVYLHLGCYVIDVWSCSIFLGNNPSRITFLGQENNPNVIITCNGLKGIERSLCWMKIKGKSCGCHELQDSCNMTMISIIPFSLHWIHVWNFILQSNVHHFASILISSLTRVYSLFIWFSEIEVCGSHFLPYSSPLPDPSCSQSLLREKEYSMLGMKRGCFQSALTLHEFVNHLLPKKKTVQRIVQTRTWTLSSLLLLLPRVLRHATADEKCNEDWCLSRKGLEQY